jgi:hypothetical protein
MTKPARLLTLCALATLALGTGHAQAGTADEAAYGAGAAAGTILYVPFKTAFCVGGGVTSFLALPFGGPPTAGKIATAACGGTWVISPGMVQRREPVRFVGGDAAPTFSARR